MRKIVVFGKPLTLILLLIIWNAIGCVGIAFGIMIVCGAAVEELVDLVRHGADIWGLLPHMALLPALCCLVFFLVFAIIANFNWNIFQGLKLSKQQIRSWTIISAMVHGMAVVLAVGVLVFQSIFWV